MRILVVDDSVVFRSQIRAALEGEKFVESIVAANSGRIALQKLEQGSTDLVTLDMEMPEMSGVETIRAIRKAKFPVRIVVFSSHTRSGTEAALDALAAGADDFAAKPTGDDVNIANVAERIRVQLLPKILQFTQDTQIGDVPAAAGGASAPVGELKTSTIVRKYDKRDLETFRPEVIVVGSSTGGPPALEKILVGLPALPRIPILIAQHMPPMFTGTLAARLESMTGIKAAEAQHGKPVLPGNIYVAPGDFHFTVKKRGNEVIANLDKGPQRNSVRPCVDNLFESAVQVYGAKTMSVILTGMGEDGLLGARAIKKLNGGVAIQEKKSCVVFGMPGAVFSDGCYDEILSLEKICEMLRRMVG